MLLLYYLQFLSRSIFFQVLVFINVRKMKALIHFISSVSEEITVGLYTVKAREINRRNLTHMYGFKFPALYLNINYYLLMLLQVTYIKCTSFIVNIRTIHESPVLCISMSDTNLAVVFDMVLA